MEQDYVELDKYIQQVVTICRSSMANLRDTLLSTPKPQRAQVMKESVNSLLEEFKLFSIVIKKVKNTPYYQKYNDLIRDINATADNIFDKCIGALLNLAAHFSKIDNLQYPVEQAIEWMLSNKVKSFPSILSTHFYYSRSIHPDNYDEYCHKIVFPELTEAITEEIQKRIDEVPLKMINDCSYKITYESSGLFQYTFYSEIGIEIVYQISHAFEPTFNKFITTNAESYFDYKPNANFLYALKEKFISLHTLNESFSAAHDYLYQELLTNMKTSSNWVMEKESYSCKLTNDLNIAYTSNQNLTLNIIKGNIEEGVVAKLVLSKCIPIVNRLMQYSECSMPMLRCFNIKYQESNISNVMSIINEGIWAKRIIMLMQIIKLTALTLRYTYYQFECVFNEDKGWSMAVKKHSILIANIFYEQNTIYISNSYSKIKINSFTTQQIFEAIDFMWRNLVVCTIVKELKPFQKEFALCNNVKSLFYYLNETKNIDDTNKHMQFIESKGYASYEDHIFIKLLVNVKYNSKIVDYVHIKVNHDSPFDSSATVLLMLKNESMITYDWKILAPMQNEGNILDASKAYAKSIREILASDFKALKYRHRYIIDNCSIKDMQKNLFRLEQFHYSLEFNDSISYFKDLDSTNLKDNDSYFYNSSTNTYKLYEENGIDMQRRMRTVVRFIQAIQTEYQNDPSLANHFRLSTKNGVYKIHWSLNTAHFQKKFTVLINTITLKINAKLSVPLNHIIDSQIVNISKNGNSTFLKELNLYLPFLTELQLLHKHDYSKIVFVDKLINEIMICYKRYKVELKISPTGDIELKDVTNIIYSEHLAISKIYRFDLLCVMLQTIADKLKLNEKIVKLKGPFLTAVEAKFDKYKVIASADSSLRAATPTDIGSISHIYTIEKVSPSDLPYLIHRMLEYLECVSLIKESKLRGMVLPPKEDLSICIDKYKPILRLHFRPCQNDKHCFRFKLEKLFPEQQIQLNSIKLLKPILDNPFFSANIIPLILHNELYPCIERIKEIFTTNINNAIKIINSTMKRLETDKQNEAAVEMQSHIIRIVRQKPNELLYSLFVDEENLNHAGYIDT